MEEQQRKEKDSHFRTKAEVGQDCNQGMTAWADPLQRGAGAKEGEDDVPGNVHTEGHLLSDEGSATVGGKGLLFMKVLSEMTLSSESHLLCKINSWSDLRSPGPEGKCSTLACIHSPAVNFPRTLKASEQLISRDK